MRELLERERLPRVRSRPPGAERGRRTLLAGWFSFGRATATAGDILVRDLVEGWLDDAGHTVDVANLPPFEGGVDWRAVDPGSYDHVVFVCGPFSRYGRTGQLVRRFNGARFVALDVSMKEPLSKWNPCEVLFERDSDRTVRPDLALLTAQPLVPVVGVCLVEHQPGPTSMHGEAEAAIRRLTETQEMSVVHIDTRLDQPDRALRTAAEVESLVARVDVMLTTRLHGMVLALKNGVPAVVIDPIAGGGKVHAQAERLGWPRRYVADSLDDRELLDALSWCLTEEAGRQARACRESAAGALANLRGEILDELARSRRELGPA